MNLVFDRLSLEEKKMFIEKVFDIKRSIIDIQFSGTIVDHFFMSMLEKVYREKLNDIINALSGKMTFNEFKDFFGSFVKIRWMIISVSLKKKFNF